MTTNERIKLNCFHVDTCLPDYFGGHHKAHIQVPVYPHMTLGELRKALHNELNQGAVGGSDTRTRDDNGVIGDKWYKAAHAAINRDVRQSGPGRKRPFSDIEDGDDCATVYAYFIFDDVE